MERAEAVVLVLWLAVDPHGAEEQVLRLLSESAAWGRQRKIPVHAFVAHPTLPDSDKLQERILTADSKEQGRVAELVREFRRARMTLITQYQAIAFRRREDLLEAIRKALGSTPQTAPAPVIEIVDALTTAFTRESLEQMVRTHLDERLTAIVPDGPLRQMVFNLVEWTERRGRTSDLVRAAYAYNPNHPALQALSQKYGTATAENLIGSQVKQLVDAILHGFDRESLELFLRYELGVSLNNIAPDGPFESFEHIAFKVVQWARAEGLLEPFLTALERAQPRNTVVVDAVRGLRAALGLPDPPAQPSPPMA